MGMRLTTKQMLVVGLALGAVGLTWAWRKTQANTVDLEVREATLAEVVHSIRRQTSKPVLVRPGEAGKITLNVRNIPLNEALDFVCDQAECRWDLLVALYRGARSRQALERALLSRDKSTWTNLARFWAPPASMRFARNAGGDTRVSLTLDEVTPQEAARALSHCGRAQVITEDGLSEKIRLQWDKLTFDEAIARLADELGCDVVRYYVLEPLFGAQRRLSPGVPPAIPQGANGAFVSGLPPGAAPVQIPLGDDLLPPEGDLAFPLPPADVWPETAQSQMRQGLLNDMRHLTPEQRAERWRNINQAPTFQR
jgi:hypothetical protein